MNAIRQTQQLNQRELENAIPPSASWHVDYRDTAYIYIGGLPLDLSEGDVVTIFSQYGNPTHLNMIRDKETGKSKGFAFLKYEDQRSCDLAVDNLGGADVLGRLLRVDHTRYKKKDDEDEDTYRIDRLEERNAPNSNGERGSETEDSDGDRRQKKKRKPMLREERELEEMLAITQDGEEQDPMREYLIKEKREEVARAKEREEGREHKHRHRHRHRDPEEEDEGRRHHHHRRRHNHHDEDAASDDNKRRARQTKKGSDIEDDAKQRRRRRRGDDDDDEVDHDRRRRRRSISSGDDNEDNSKQRKRNARNSRSPPRRRHRDGDRDDDKLPRRREDEDWQPKRRSKYNGDVD